MHFLLSEILSHAWLKRVVVWLCVGHWPDWNCYYYYPCCACSKAAVAGSLFISVCWTYVHVCCSLWVVMLPVMFIWSTGRNAPNSLSYSAKRSSVQTQWILEQIIFCCIHFLSFSSITKDLPVTDGDSDSVFDIQLFLGCTISFCMQRYNISVCEVLRYVVAGLVLASVQNSYDITKLASADILF